MHQIDSIKNEITKLSQPQQMQIAFWIISDLDDVNDNQNAVDAAWRAEVKTRVNDIKSGKVKMIKSSEMWNELLENYVETS